MTCRSGLGIVALLMVVGCDGTPSIEDLAQQARDAAERIKEETAPEVQRLAELSGNLHDRLLEKDWAGARQAGLTIDRLHGVRVAGWTVETFIIDERDGAVPAQEYLAALAARDDLSEREQSYLAGFQEVFEKKGDLQTLTVVTWVAVFICDAKLGHGGAGIPIAIEHVIRGKMKHSEEGGDATDPPGASGGEGQGR